MNRAKQYMGQVETVLKDIDFGSPCYIYGWSLAGTPLCSTHRANVDWHSDLPGEPIGDRISCLLVAAGCGAVDPPTASMGTRGQICTANMPPKVVH